MTQSLLAVEDLSVAYGEAQAVHGVSLHVDRGEAFGLVGESGSGKSTVAMALVRYLARGGHVTGGRIIFDGQDLMDLDDAALRAFRGRRAAVVYQNPGAALDPSMIVGDQVSEAFSAHANLSSAEARRQAIDMLRHVQLPDAESVYRRYPHQLSGGMQQRVVIASALAASPDLLILDEPTTGLDATVEAAILGLLATLRRELGVTILLISHNLAVVAEVCDRVGVLYAGRLVEQGAVAEVFAAPAHPYTAGLLSSLPQPGSNKAVKPLQPIGGQPHSAAVRIPGCTFEPRCALARPTCSVAEPDLLDVSENRASRCYFWDEVLGEHPMPTPPDTSLGLIGSPHPRPLPRGEGDVENPWNLEPLLSTTDVGKTFSVNGGRVVAVDGVSLSIAAGQTVGLVGESGSGKSTLARVIAGLEPLDSGKLAWHGSTLNRIVGKRPKSVLRELQMVFQDPDSTLNPRHTVRTLLERSIKRLTTLSPSARRARAAELLAAVDLEPRHLSALPSELSGGQRQRVAIARAFAGSPALVLCDEPTSALDASVQATILNLLDRLQREQGSAYLFISHDIDVVRYLSDVVGVLYLGRLMQLGTTASVFAPPLHPYTEVLLASVPRRDRQQRETPAAPAAQTRPTHGCPFQFRCPRKLGPICETDAPPWRALPDGGGLLCHIPSDELARAQTAP
ncbi:MAG: ABC transporter ATP-binding protein [Chloroflexi bacterium]|nr:ABC transporter ATP-binding protein [Chloroflexota bacterium]